MKIYIKTRGYTDDYEYLGNQPAEKWWSEFQEWASEEYPTIIFSSDKGKGRLYLTAIPSKRRDIGSRVNRNIISIEDIQRKDCEQIFGILDCYIENIPLYNSNLKKDIQKAINSELSKSIDEFFTEEYVENFFKSDWDDSKKNEILKNLEKIIENFPKPKNEADFKDNFKDIKYWTCGLNNKERNSRFFSFILYSLKNKNKSVAAYFKGADEDGAKNIIDKLTGRSNFDNSHKAALSDIKEEFSAMGKKAKKFIPWLRKEKTIEEKKYSTFGFLINNDSNFRELKAEEKKTVKFSTMMLCHIILAMFIVGFTLYFLTKTNPYVSKITANLRSQSVLDLSITIANASDSPSVESMSKNILIKKYLWDQTTQTLSVSAQLIYDNKAATQNIKEFYQIKMAHIRIANIRNNWGLSIPPLEIIFSYPDIEFKKKIFQNNFDLLNRFLYGKLNLTFNQKEVRDGNRTFNPGKFNPLQIGKNAETG